MIHSQMLLRFRKKKKKTKSRSNKLLRSAADVFVQGVLGVHGLDVHGP